MTTSSKVVATAYKIAAMVMETFPDPDPDQIELAADSIAAAIGALDEVFPDFTHRIRDRTDVG